MTSFLDSVSKMPDAFAYLMVGGSLLVLGLRRRQRPVV